MAGFGAQAKQKAAEMIAKLLHCVCFVFWFPSDDKLCSMPPGLEARSLRWLTGGGDLTVFLLRRRARMPHLR